MITLLFQYIPKNIHYKFNLLDIKLKKSAQNNGIN